MVEIPLWWLVLTGIVAALSIVGVIFAIALITVLMKAVREMQPRVASLMTRVEVVANKVESIGTQAESIADSAKGIAFAAESTVDRVATKTRNALDGTGSRFNTFASLAIDLLLRILERRSAAKSRLDGAPKTLRETVNY
jgi:hypothetical protein